MGLAAASVAAAGDVAAAAGDASPDAAGEAAGDAAAEFLFFFLPLRFLATEPGPLAAMAWSARMKCCPDTSAASVVWMKVVFAPAFLPCGAGVCVCVCVC